MEKASQCWLKIRIKMDSVECAFISRIFFEIILNW